MIRFLIKRTCELAILAMIICGLLYAAATVAPAFAVGIGGGIGVDGGVIQYQIQIQKATIQPRVGPPPVKPKGLNDG